MKSKLRFFWVVPLLALGSGLLPGSADEPAGLERGHVLVLRKTWQAWEGDIVRRSRQYVVERNGAKMIFPESEVLCLCARWDDALEHLKERINRNSVDDHLRLAEWCHCNKLHKEALDEAEAALNLNTEHKKARILCKIYDDFLKKAIGEASKPPAPQPATDEPPEVEIDSDLENLFSRKVEPILLNRCLNCHNPTRSSKFELRNPSQGPRRDATLRNLGAVLRQLDRDEPTRSPLLEKAVEYHHGIEKSPFPNRYDPSYAVVEDWVKRVVAKPWTARPPSTAVLAPDLTPRSVDFNSEPLATQVNLPGPPVSVERKIQSDGSFSPRLGSNVRPSTFADATGLSDVRPVPSVFDETPRIGFVRRAPAFPEQAPLPRTTETIVRTSFCMPAELPAKMPAFPGIAALPHDLPHGVLSPTQPLLAVEGPRRLPMPAAATPKTPAPGRSPTRPDFQFHPVPEPAIEASPPEPTADEFDPRQFPSK